MSRWVKCSRCDRMYRPVRTKSCPLGCRSPFPDYSVRDLIRDLRSGPYTSVGSYPKFFTTADSAVLSFAAVRSEVWEVCRAIRDQDTASGFRVIACGINWEDPELICDHFGTPIEAAYSEPSIIVR